MLKSRNELDIDREIKLLEKYNPKKYKKDYIDKVTLLLHNSRNQVNYYKKRNNIKKAIYKLDDNNELYLTLPKLKEFKTKEDVKPYININNLGNHYTKTETTEYSNNIVSSKPSAKRRYECDDDILDENIKEILYDNDNENKKLEEELKGKILFEKLKTKYNLNNVDKNNRKRFKSLPKFQKKKIPSQYKLIATPQQISEFDYNLGRSFVNGKLRYITKAQKEKLSYIAELNIFNSIERLREKTNMIKEIKNDGRRKKIILMPIDFFKYDEKKWKKIAIERNKNLNDMAINEINEKNKEKINDMKEKLNKLSVDAFIVDKEVNKTINNINYFINRYGIDNGISRQPSHSSNRSIRYQSSKKRDRKVSEEKKE
jgi:hypothetical protein